MSANDCSRESQPCNHSTHSGEWSDKPDEERFLLGAIVFALSLYLLLEIVAQPFLIMYAVGK